MHSSGLLAVTKVKHPQVVNELLRQSEQLHAQLLMQPRAKRIPACPVLRVPSRRSVPHGASRVSRTAATALQKINAAVALVCGRSALHKHLLL